MTCKIQQVEILEAFMARRIVPPELIPECHQKWSLSTVGCNPKANKQKIKINFRLEKLYKVKAIFLYFPNPGLISGSTFPITELRVEDSFWTLLDVVPTFSLTPGKEQKSKRPSIKLKWRKIEELFINI